MPHTPHLDAFFAKLALSLTTADAPEPTDAETHAAFAEGVALVTGAADSLSRIADAAERIAETFKDAHRTF